MRIDLQVPYSDKDAAKSAGARWDGSRRGWFIENVEVLDPFMRWMRASHAAPHALTPSEARAATEQARKYPPPPGSVYSNGPLEMPAADPRRAKQAEKRRAKLTTPGHTGIGTQHHAGAAGATLRYLPACACTHVAPWDACQHTDADAPAVKAPLPRRTVNLTRSYGAVTLGQ